MDAFATVSRNDLNPDGTPRRKYDERDSDGPNRGLQAATVLSVASVFALLKNVLFGEEDGKAHAERMSGQPEPHGATADDEFETELPRLRLVHSAPMSSSTTSLGQTSSANDQPFAMSFEPTISFSRDGEGRPDLGRFGLSFGAFPVGTSAVAYQEIPAPTDAAGGAPVTGPAANDDAPLESGESGFEPGDQVPGDDDDDGDDEPPPDRTNRLPVVGGPVFLSSISINHVALLTFADLTRGAWDPDGDALTVRDITVTSGSFTASGDGRWTFVPDADMTGMVEFRYKVADADGGTDQVAFMRIVDEMDVSVPGSTFYGTDASERIVGTVGDDRIDGRGGDDVIVGREGDDVILGGDGNDRILGDDGDDFILAGAGDDVVFAGAGNDLVLGEAGDDQLFGEIGNDELFGGAGADVIYGGDDDDWLSGDEGYDHLLGEAGSDVLMGGVGNDRLEGGEGDDILVGEEGQDEIFGGAGDDTILALVDDGNDTIDGGDGIDTLSFAGVDTPVTVDLDAGLASSDSTGNDLVTGIENVVGGSGDDIIVANDEANVLTGGVGRDIFVFLAANKGKDVEDQIADFEVGDKIDIKAFDGDLSSEGLQRLNFVYDQAEFDGVAQVMMHYVDADDGRVTIIEFNLSIDDGDRDDPEFVLRVTGIQELHEGDFIT